MNFDNDDDIMKAINSKVEGNDMDVDDELAALEAEMGVGKKKGKKKKKEGEELSLSDLSEEEEAKPPKKEKHESDDDLAALEKEGLDDIDDEDEKPKQQKKPQAQPQQPKKQQSPSQQPKKQPPPSQPKPQINKQELAKAMQAKKPQAQSSGEDLYPEKGEKRYHDVNKMTSLGVLEKEKEICDQIIEYKKKIDQDYDDWTFKKESIDDKIALTTSTIQDGIWDFEMYKKKIKEQYQYESKLLLFVDKDPVLSQNQKDKVKERVNNRKKIIEEELTRKIEDEEGDEGEQEESKKEETTKTQTESKQEEKPSNQTNAPTSGADYYPEKAEKLYHNISKMESLGVLEKEKGVCDIIIAYKKKKNEDPGTWEIKKDSISTRFETIKTTIENGIIDFESYKKKIKSESLYEAKLLQFIEKDPKLDDIQKKVVRERIKKRISIIEEELKKNIDEEDDEEPEKEQAPKIEEKKKKEELLTKKSLNPMYTVEKGEEEKEIQRLTQVVKDRLNEYRAAQDYFKTNELSEQQMDAIQKTKAICIELKKIQDGKWKEVNEFKLPDPVTPEYIYGYSKEVRLEKFKKIMTEYNKQRKGIQEEINNKLEAFKKLSKIQFKKIEAVAKKDLDRLKTKKEKIEKIVKLLAEKSQDKWVPAPLYIESEEEREVIKQNKDIPENTIRIIFGKTTYSKKERLYLIVKYEEKNLVETFNQTNPGDWTHQFDWKLEKADFLGFFKAKIHVDIYEKKTILKDRLKGQFDIEPRGLKEKIEISDKYKITLESKREGATVDVTIKARNPCKGVEKEIKTETVFNVTRIYPPFDIRGNNVNSGIRLEVQQASVTADDLKVNKSTAAPKAAPKKVAPRPSKQNATPNASKPKAPAASGAPKKQGPPKAHIDKSEFKSEELNDPDCIDCLNTLMVLDFKINKYEEIRNKIDGRTPRELMQRIVKMKCKKQSITDSLGDDISPQDYLTLLKTTFAHDKKLVDYFNQEKNIEKSKLVSERLPLIVKETEELMKQMPK